LDTEEPVESPTYDAFDSLLGGGDNRVEASQKATFDECEDTDEFHKEDKMSPVNNNQKNTAGRKHNNKNSSRIQAALSLLASKERVDARVFQANAAGVLVSLSSDKKPRKHHSDHQENQITAFVPFSQLSKEHAKKVVDAQKKAKISLGASADDDPAVIRKAGMSVLLNNVLQVTVLSVDEDQQRVVCTERTDNRNRAPALTESVAKKISSRIGEIVQNATVCNITDFGVFVTFHLPGIADDDDQASLVGLVYSSELCWDERSSLDISIGDRVKAQIIHVDVEKRHIFLSIKRTEPNPLLETLDQLLATPQQRDVSLSSNAAAGSSRETFDTAENTDLRPLLGDLLEAVNLVEVLHAAGFPTAVMGPRLQSKIVSSQNIELYVSKNEPESRMIRLVVRKGYDVQQIEISGDSNVRQSLMVTLSKLDL
jgi:predicted RNA-binding protein with RPS1 domain